MKTETNNKFDKHRDISIKKDKEKKCYSNQFAASDCIKHGSKKCDGCKCFY